jgi:TonB-linked SusC/RagA family outer membrane protein
MRKKHIISIKIVLFCISVLLIATNPVNAQAKKGKLFLTGKVTDIFGKSLVGAQVRLENTEQIAVTNMNGKFELNVYDPKAVLEISCTGFGTKKIIKGDKMVVDVVLNYDASLKDQQISTVYDKRESYSVTSSVVTISGEELNKTPFMNLAAALAGRLPGLVVRQSTAEPGAETFSLNIRGLGTSNGRSPLVLIDGVPSGNLQSINPRDVASVTVFRDGASNALYGMQAGNGTISIITKSGDYGKPRIKISMDQSYRQPLNTPDMVSSYEYAKQRNQAYKNDGYGDFYAYSESKVDGYKAGDTIGFFPNNNWYKYFMEPMVKSQRYNFSATGGFDGLKYYTSVGYSNVGSPYKTDGGTPQSNDRIDFRTNVDVKLNKYISTSMKISGLLNRKNSSIVSAADILSSVFNMPPTIYGPLTPNDKVVATPQTSSPTYGSINRSGFLQQTTTKMNTILGLDVDLSFITKGLSAQASAMFDASAYSNVNGTTTYEKWIRNDARQDSLIFIKQGTDIKTPLSLTKGVSTSYMSNSNALLRYDQKFNLHSVGAIAFVRYQHENHADLNINGILPYQRLTYGGRFNYGYSNLIFADLAASYEGSEQFAPENRFGLFLSASLAWVVSNHEFLKDNEILTFLKLRASHAIVGNDQFGSERFLYRDNISRTGTGFIAGLGAPIEELQAGNRMLTWEKSKKSNLGIELGFWNQLTLGFDVFNEDRSDILVTLNSVPMSQGVPNANLPMANKGLVNNKGFEVQLGYSKTFSKDFSVNLQTYMDYNINTVLESDEVSLGTDYAYQYRSLGYSMGQNFGYEIDKSNGSGYFNSATEIASSGLTYEGSAPRPGDFIYKDLNGDKIINVKDMAPMGSPTVPRISWGANLNVRWKNFDASVLMQGLSQVSQFNSGLGYYDYVNNGTYFNLHRNAWTAERFANGQEISAPALSALANSSNKANDFYLADKSFIRIKNVEIGYQIPTVLTNKIKMESVRIYVNGNNLLTFDNQNNKDVDIEMGSYTTFPTNRTLNVGLNVTF